MKNPLVWVIILLLAPSPYPDPGLTPKTIKPA